MELVLSFLAGASRPCGPDESQVLAGRLGEALDRSHEAWPGVVLSGDTFARHLGERVPPELPLTEGLRALKVEDLYLARACLDGDRAALEALQRAVLLPMSRAVRRVDRSDTFVDEVLQLTRLKLLVGSARQGPRLAEYAGRGALRRWTEAIAVGVALSLKRGPPRAVSLDDAPLVSELHGADPELALIQQRYRPAFRAAFAEALSQLSPRDRNLLRLSLGQGLGVESLGTLHQVHASTVSRWLTRARQSLLEGTRAGLSRRLTLNVSQLDSLLRVMDASLAVSLSSLLDEG
ncbi:sigma-70 family RNA polymerase sigma factor [Myxococcus sp. AM011]|uniref:sigma-70 family RNA polymerase sigma factor n=1 Tax=Myxococcus sp. AM011 TaxID=2745200 RepID=UPI0015954A9F|nr:sigma-70 family RNA polymerase sigma factor [Myxococcus sp. AM011]NVJ25035.1 sigma-70 family RNA polymerase sigma factor [Myxococcus sp. AM011]